MHITRTAIAEPTLFGRELVLAAVDSFMRLPAAPHRITPARSTEPPFRGASTNPRRAALIALDAIEDC